MFGYMTDLSTVEETRTEEISAQGTPPPPPPPPPPLVGGGGIIFITSTHSLTGDDLESLLFHLLDEFLFTFSADPFFIPKVCL